MNNERKECNHATRYVQDYIAMWAESIGDGGYYRCGFAALVDAAAMAYYGIASLSATGRNSHWGWLARDIPEAPCSQ